MNKIEAVLFDMDGVIIDSEPLWEKSEEEVFQNEYGIDIKTFNEIHNINTTGHRIDSVAKLYSQYLPEKAINTNVLAEQILTTVIKKIINHNQPMPGLKETIELIRSLNLKIALASSSPMSVINTVLDTLNIRHYFDKVISAEKLEYGKPHPAVYLEAAKQLGIEPRNCITIEDSIAGMIATKAATMRSIVMPAINDREKKEWALADHQIKSLYELKAAHFSKI